MRAAAVAAALFALVVSSSSQSSDPAAVGQWSTSQAWPVVSVHAQMLPTGKVLFYPYTDGPFLWDPATTAVVPARPAGFNLFCTGHSYLADGRLFVAGGHIANNVGLPNAAIYNPFTDTWTNVPDMNAGRWYPTNTTLPNGDVLVVSGDVDRTVWVNVLPQVWQNALGTWRDLTNAQLALPLYPFMFVAPNGKVFNAGPNQATRYLDVAGAGSWSYVADNNFGLRDYGSAVMFDTGKVLIVGGGGEAQGWQLPPTATAETIDLQAAQPSWTYVSPMAVPRRQHNATLLPDGKVLVTGGSSGAGFDNAAAPVFATEMWDPATDTWTAMAAASEYRGYHSIALLLPDGRVLSAGGDNHPTAQVYSPPYLFRGARPAITSAPSNVAYGETFQIGTPDAAGIAAVTLIRLSAVTHAFNQDQRIARLPFVVSSGALQATSPAGANLAPPGRYMLFILNGQGVPSIARIVQVGTGAPVAPPAAPTGLTATAISAGRVNLAWTDASATEEGFHIERATGASSTAFTPIASVNANVTAYSDLTVQPETTYTYRVRAYNSTASAVSNAASATTPAATTPGAEGWRRFNGTTDYIDFPSAPNVNTVTLAFFFTPLSLPAAGERDVLATYSEQGQPEPFGTHDKELFLTPEGILKARVYAGGPITVASSAALTVGQRYHVAMTVSGTTLTLYVDGTVEAAAAAAGSYAGYADPNLRLAGLPDTVDAGAVNTRAHGDFSHLGEWRVALTGTQMASLAAGAAVTSVQPDALVVAATFTSDPPGADVGGPVVMNGTTFVTSTTATAPAAPTGVAATAVSANRVDVTWEDVSTTEDGFRLERATGAGSTSFTQIAIVNANVVAYSDLTVQPATTYTYRVRAYNTAGSNVSVPAGATTPSTTPPEGPAGQRRFNGTTDYVDFPSAPNVDSATIAFFFTPLSLPAAGERDVLVTYSEEGESEPFATHDKELFVTPEGILKARVYAGGPVTVASSTALAVGQRRHVAMTVSGTTLTVYVDGTVQAAVAAAGSYAGYADPRLRLAGRPETLEADAVSTRAHGDFSHFGGWAVALTSAQVASLAAGGAVTSVQPDALVVAASLTSDPPSAEVGGPLVLSGTTFVTAATSAPAAPTGVTATAVSATQVDVAWQDASTTEDGFRIERATGAGSTTFTQIASAGPNATSYSDLTAQPATTYAYRVRAYNSAGSNVSAPASATTPAALSPPAAPANLTAKASQPTRVNLSWADRATNESGFRVERATGSSTTFGEVGTVGVNVTSYSDLTAQPSTTYSYRVRAYNSAGSAVSNTATVTTPAPKRR